jgi:DNA-binding HxlR family transcriptional regulator
MAIPTTTHFQVPTFDEARHACLGPEGSAAHTMRVIRMIQGRWKVPILFRLFADPCMRTLQMKRDLGTISQKVLTQHLRELAEDGLVERVEHAGKFLHVEYRLTEMGKELRQVLVAARTFSVGHPLETAC